MKNKMISIPEELFDLLKLENNASKLISSLLFDYYKANKENEQDLDKELEILKQKRINALKVIEEEEKKIHFRKEIIEKQREVEVKAQEVNQAKEDEKLKNIKLTFLEETGREMSEEEIAEFLDRIDKERGFNLFYYIQEINGLEAN